MSRGVCFELDGYSAGEFEANIDRGWAVIGSSTSESGGTTSVAIADDLARKPWLQLGRVVMLTHPKLPNWAGVIDTPWKASLPVAMTLYNAEYLLKMRAPDNPVGWDGDAQTILSNMVGLANMQEQMFVRMGDVYDAAVRSCSLDQRSIWEQLTELVERWGLEMVFRPERIEENKFGLYLDVAPRVGVDTGFLLHDGKNANARLVNASVDGEIWNRVIGIGSQSTSEERLQTEPMVDSESVETYRLRSHVVQFSGAKKISTLNDNAVISLEQTKRPRLTVKADALDVGDTFYHLRPGNSVNGHFSGVRLPGGVVGWRGIGRIMSMVFTENTNMVNLTLEAWL